MPEANTSGPTGRAGGTSWPRGSVGGMGAAQPKWEWAAQPVPWNTCPWGHATRGHGLGRVWAMPCDPSTIRTHSSGATSKRAEPDSCCSCAAEPADGNLGPSMASGSRGCGTAWPGGTGHPGRGTASGGQRVTAWPCPSPERG